MEGRCQCSQVRFTTPVARPEKLYICHCSECRHQSSSSYGLTAIFPSFDIPAPADGAAGLGTYTRRTLSGRSLECVFCKNCGVRLMHRGRGEETLSVKAGCLEGLTREMMRNAAHIWCKEAVIDIPDGVEQWEEEPTGGSLR